MLISWWVLDSGTIIGLYWARDESAITSSAIMTVKPRAKTK